MRALVHTHGCWGQPFVLRMRPRKKETGARCTVISEPLPSCGLVRARRVRALLARHLATRIVGESIVTGPADSLALTLICGEALAVRTIRVIFDFGGLLVPFISRFFFFPWT